jgi:hypothetical protein
LDELYFAAPVEDPQAGASVDVGHFARWQFVDADIGSDDNGIGIGVFIHFINVAHGYISFHMGATG